MMLLIKSNVYDANHPVFYFFSPLEAESVDDLNDEFSEESNGKFD